MNTDIQGKMVLSGGGGKDQCKFVDSEFVEILPRPFNLAYLPIGLRRGFAGYESCLDWLQSVFDDFGVGEEADISMHVDLQGRQSRNARLFEYSGLYIGGGWTSEIVSAFCKSDRWSEVDMLLRNGGVVYGGSAGAMALGQWILPHTERARVSGVDKQDLSKGIDALGGWSVFADFESKYEGYLRNVSRQMSLRILALAAGTGVVVEEKSSRVCVGGRVKVFDSGTVTTLNSGESICQS